MSNVIGDIWQSLRPIQWIKNLIVFTPLFFSNNLFVPEKLIYSFIAFVILCFLSSASYLLNDIMDKERDKKHPVKSERPIASGRLSVLKAGIVAVFLSLISLLSTFTIGSALFKVALGFLILNILYSIYLKNLIIIDVFTIAASFILRIVAGSVAIDVKISSWLFICSTLLALFLGFGKRRHELTLLGEDATNHRELLKEYSPYLLDQMMSVITASTLMSYSLYTISEETVNRFGTDNLKFTIPFVLYGIMRYLYLIHIKEKGGRPEWVLLTDTPILICVLLYTLTSVFILYFK